MISVYYLKYLLNKGALDKLVALKRAIGFFVQSVGEEDFELLSSNNEIPGDRMEGYNDGSRGRWLRN